MPKFIEMPKLSDTMTEGTLAKWTVKEGDKVTVGKAIADIETDKATMEYASPFEGVLHKFIATPGGKVPLGAPLAVILEDGEAAPADLDEQIAKAKAAAAPAPLMPQIFRGAGFDLLFSENGIRLRFRLQLDQLQLTTMGPRVRDAIG